MKRAMKFVPALGVVLALAVPAAAQATTASQRNAVESAHNYLSFGAFSRTGLIQQLSSKYGDGYPTAVAVYAVNQVHANWYKQAVKLGSQLPEHVGVLEERTGPAAPLAVW